MAKSVRPGSWLKQLALGVGALATVIYTAQHVRPVYAGRAPVVADLFEPTEWGDSALARAPWAKASGDVAAALQTLGHMTPPAPEDAEQ